MKKLLLIPFFLFTFGLSAQEFWTEVSPFPTGSSFFPNQMSNADANIIWVIGFSPTSTTLQKWARSVDGGVTWTSGDIPLETQNLHVSSIHAVSATTAYITINSLSFSAPYGGIYITTDGGITWTKQGLATNAFQTGLSFPYYIHFWDANNGLAIGINLGLNFEMYTTTDAGANWTRVPVANIPLTTASEYNFYSNYEIRGNSIWFATSTGRIFRSADKGLHWNVSQTPVDYFDGSETMSYFAFRNENEGLLLGKNGGYWKTIDGGATWNPASVESSSAYALRPANIVFVPQTNNAYFNWGTEIATSIRGSSYATDGGFHWEDLDAETQPVMPIFTKFQSGTVGYCIGRYLLDSAPVGMRFFRMTDPLNHLSVKNFSPENQMVVSPNPTDGIAKLSGMGINQVSIIDITGKTIFSQNYNSLNEITLDMTSFENGIYFANLTNNSGSLSTFKIVKN